MIDRLREDIRYACASARRRPRLIGIAVLMIAIGIGGATSIFSVADALVLRPLPYRAADRLIVLGERDSLRNLEGPTSYPVFRAWAEESRSFESLAASNAEVLELTLTGRGDAVIIDTAVVSGGFFDTFGVNAAVGRTLLTSADTPGTTEVVLSDSLWRERFDADPAVVGTAIVLGERSYTVVGVMPPAFAYPRWAQLWIPLRSNDSLLAAEIADGLFQDVGVGVGWLNVIGRHKDDVEVAAVGVELTDTWRRVYRSTAGARGWTGLDSFIDHHGAAVTQLTDFVRGPTRPVLLMILSASILVLLIASANVAGLLLMRSAERRREIAIRQALGATGARVIRAQLVEALLLSTIGASGGVLMARWGAPLLARLSPADIARVDQIAIDLRVIAFSAAAAMVVAIVCGLAPVMLVRRSTLDEMVRRASSRSLEAHGQLWASLVVSQVSVAIVLLCAAGLVIRTFINLRDAPLGFEADRVLTVGVATKSERYRTLAPRRRLYQRLVPRVRGLPGVDAVAMVTRHPLWGTTGYDFPFTVEGQTEASALGNPPSNLLAVTSDYFRAMGMHVRGRAFTDLDRDGQPGVAIVSEAFARFAWPGRDPIGMRVKTRIPGTAYDSNWLTVVGVAAESRYRELEGSRMDLYLSYLQADHPLNSLIVRTSVDPAIVTRDVREAVRAIDGNVAVTEAARMSDVVSRRLAGRLFTARLFAVFAVLALMLACVGVYSLLAHAVTSRTREMGLRMALGARSIDVRRLVTGYGVRLSLTGVLIGVAVTLAVGRYLTSLLYGVTATDPLTIALAPLILLATASAASFVPAVRATRVDPAIVLREE